MYLNACWNCIFLWVGLKLQVCTLMTENNWKHLHRQSCAVHVGILSLDQRFSKVMLPPLDTRGTTIQCDHGFSSHATYSNKSL